MSTSGLLYSQIGYDLFDTKRALIRSSDKCEMNNIKSFCLINEDSKEEVYEGEVRYWGELWGLYWWELDFTSFDVPGQYVINVRNSMVDYFDCQPFKISKNLLWSETMLTVAIEQFEERNQMARNKIGWKDCGSTLREAYSHALALLGFCDLLQTGFQWLTFEENKRAHSQLIIGCDYLVLCQQTAQLLGFPTGSLLHEIPNGIEVVTADVMLTAWVLIRASRLILDVCPEKSREYFECGEKAFSYIMEMEPNDKRGFNPQTHGAPENFNLPQEWQTRDLVYQLGAAVELCKMGRGEYKEVAVGLANQIVERQVPIEFNEFGLFGHFYTYKNCGFTEKANTHNGVGMDMGAVLPHYILPLIDARRLFADNEDSLKWDKAILDFAYHYFIPACKQNPFHIIPQGVFGPEGLLVFSGPWHGTNVTIAYASALASILGTYTEDPVFKEIAVGNLQWIAGLNAGFTSESFKGRYYWKADIEPGNVVPFSMIEGIGNNSVKGWSGIKGSIQNGFCTNEQFRTNVIPAKATDGPWIFTDEDWISHSGGWISALTFLRSYNTYYDDRASKLQHT